MSLLQQIYEQNLEYFKNLPWGVLLMNTLVNFLEPEEAPFVEISTIGASDYAIYEVEQDKVTLLQTKPHNLFVFNQPCHAFFSTERPVLEIRFQVQRRTYLVSGCPNFWSLMDVHTITPLLNIFKDIANVASDIIQVACKRFFMNRANKPLSEDRASKLCSHNLIPEVFDSILCRVTEIYYNKPFTGYANKQGELIITDRTQKRKRSKDNSPGRP